MQSLRGLSLLTACVVLAGATYAVAHGNDHHEDDAGDQPSRLQIVALDECDPASFNAVLGESGGGFCHNVSLAAFGFATTLDDLFKKAAAGTPDPNWDFEPDDARIDKGTAVSVVNQGGQEHTFTEVKQFGGGFIEGLNNGQATIPECEGGFANLKVARTRVVQGSQVEYDNLSRGKHKFQCCIHPWMHFELDVK